MREMVALTDVPEATLRVWERRHGLPSPERLPGGHRRYSQRDVEQVRAVVAEREAGASLPAAIERARRRGRDVEPSVFAAVRRRHPALEPRLLPKRLLTALSHAVEDEVTARAERGLLLGSFQRVAFYRRSARRWRELARTAQTAIAFADFDRLRRPRGAPVEVPIEPAHPLRREWALVYRSSGCAACIAAWEPPRQRRATDAARVFEVLFTLDPAVVRDAAELLLDLAEEVAIDAEGFGTPTTADQLALSAAITGRVLERVGGAA